MFYFLFFIYVLISVELTTTIKMVNIFGNQAVRGRKGERGPSGLRGLPGQKGDAGSIEDWCMWMGNTVLKNLELYDVKGCFFIDDPSTDVDQKEKTIIKWLSKTLHKKKNLIAEKPMFDGAASYYSDELGLFQVTPGNCFGFLCITFKTTSDDKDQVLLSTYQTEGNPYTDISISGAEKNIVITSIKETKNTILIENDVKQWTTLYVEYKGYESKTTEYNYIVKCSDSKIISGSFLLEFSDLAMFGFAMGSRFNDTGFLKGEISSLEIYHVDDPSKPFPECLKKLILDNHVMKTPSSSKKSRDI